MPPAKQPPRRAHQLPAGRHGLDREFVVSHQRRRILDAVATVCARSGFANMSVQDLLKEAGLSRRTFYDYYENRDGAFLDAYEQASTALMAVVREAYAGSDSFVEAVQDCVEAFLVTLAANPDSSAMAIVEVLAAGPAAIERRNATMGEFADLLRDAAERFKQPSQGPALLPQTIVGGMYEVVYTRLLERQASALPDLLPDFVYTALLPYLGNEAARTEYDRLVARRDRLQSAGT